MKLSKKELKERSLSAPFMKGRKDAHASRPERNPYSENPAKKDYADGYNSVGKRGVYLV